MPEPYATYEDQKACWDFYEMTGRNVIHLRAGDILMKKNFGEDKAPGGLEGIISWAQRAFSHKNAALKNASEAKAREHRPDPVLNSMFPGVNLDGPPNNRTTKHLANRQAVTSLNFDPFADSEGDDTGDWTTGHVAIAIDPARLAEQTGTGVMINTLNVTEHHIQEHNVADVYYYVYRCNQPAIAKNAAMLAERFAASRPMNKQSASPIFTKGNYTLLPASRAVLGRSSLRQRSYTDGQQIVLDKFSQNILDFCEGRAKERTAMYCSAFVLAVYQAACVYTFSNDNISMVGIRPYLLNLDARYILPRHYEGALRQNKAGYTFEGTYRWKNLPYEKKATNLIEQLRYNFSQAIDNYANHVSIGHGARAMGGLHLTGYDKISLTPTNRQLAKKLVETKKKEINNHRKSVHLAANNNSKVRAFFKKRDDTTKEATDLDALNTWAAISSQRYNKLYELRQMADAQLNANDRSAVLAFFSACEQESRTGEESLLRIHLRNAMEKNEAHSALLQRVGEK